MKKVFQQRATLLFSKKKKYVYAAIFRNMKGILIPLLFFIATQSFSQNVGLGTNNPNPRAILDLSSTNKVLLLPRLTNAQMDAIVSPPYGSLIYNTDQHQYMGYVYSHTRRIPDFGGGFINQTVAKWLPLNTGPKMIAWGIVDSFANEINSSGNVSISWDGYGNGAQSTTNNWYTLTLIGGKFYKDSMILMVTALGNGSWDQAIAIGELVESSTIQRATIKFTDVSRISNDWNLEASRRRSNFYFVLYDLRKDPY